MNAQHGAKGDSGKPTESHRASWRKPQGTGSGGSGGTRSRGWTDHRQQGIRRDRWRHGAKLAGYLVFALVLIGALISYLLFRPIPTPLLAVAVTAYEGQFPPNSLAWEDIQRFRQMTQNYDNLRFVGATEDIDGESRLKVWLEKQLTSVRPGGPRKNVLILYLSAHGVLDHSGRPCLVLPDHDPLDSSTWLSMDELLGEIERHERLASVKKLLVLDVGRIQTDWGLGVLYNGFADKLADAVVTANVPDLYVLNATAPGQRSCAAPELGGSAFGFFLARGLRGAADARDGNGRVSMRELHKYLRTEVGNWVQVQRSDQQEPMLMGPSESEEDFELTYVTGDQLPEPAPITNTLERERNDGFWRQHQRFAQQQVYREYPWEWAELEDRLLRLEQLAVAGQAYEPQVNATIDRIESLLSGLEQPPPEPTLRSTNLPTALAQRHGSPQQLESAREVLAQWQKWRAEPEPDPNAAPPRIDYDLATHAIWSRLLEQPSSPSQAQVAELLQFLETADRKDVDGLAEMHFLQMLYAFLDWQEPIVQQNLHRALQARSALEQLVLPPDPRSHFWAQRWVDQLAPPVRIAEDGLFVGSGDSLRAATDQWDRLLGVQGQGGTLATALEGERLISKALATRDEALSGLPDLARWVMGQARWHPGSGLSDTLAELIVDVRQLGMTLEEGPGSRDLQADVEAVDQQRTKVRESLNRLVTAYLQRCRFFLELEAGEVRQQLPEIELLLSVALVTGEQRNAMRDVYLDKLASDAAASSATQNIGEDDTTYLEFLAGLKEHPVSSILDRRHLSLSDSEIAAAPETDLAATVADRPTAVTRLAETGGSVRTALSQISATRLMLVRHSTDALASTDLQPPVTLRRGVSRADRMVRAAAALIASRPSAMPEDHPSVVLRAIDGHFALLWRSTMRLDDFWGPARENGSPFFSRAAANLLDQAQHLLRGAASYRLPAEKLLRDRTQLAQAGLPLQAENLLMAPDETTAEHKLRVASAASWPRGQAALFVRWPGANGELFPLLGSQRQPLRRRGVAIGPGTQETTLSHAIRASSDLDETTYLEAIALFRGHQVIRPFMAGGRIQGDVVTSLRPDYPPPTIRVKGKAKQISQVLFILDCSASMDSSMAFEGKQSTRLNVAKDRLKTILRALPEQNYQIGLMLFGHRAGWEQGHVKPRNPRRDEGLHPGADVELVVPVGQMQFRDTAGELGDRREQIAEMLESLAPWGETPLYYALKRALTCFDSQLASPRHIIVVTDGVDEQSTDAPAETITRRRDVEAALADPRYQGTRVDIVEFGTSEADKQKSARARADLMQIARSPDSGGDFHEARDPSSLLDALEASLPWVKFGVNREEEPAPREDQYIDLGKAWTVQPWDDSGWFQVKLAGVPRAVEHRVRLEGGESLELEYDREEARLEHGRYTQSQREFAADLRDPLQISRRFYVGTHVPLRRADEVVFPVSIQNAEARLFSARPQHIWAEIRPVFTDRTERIPVYVFYDLEFAPERPVPVLRFRIPRWPVQSRRANLRLWFRPDDDIEPEQTINIVSTEPKSFQFDDLPDVQFRVEPRPGTENEPYRVVVVEQHEPGTNLYKVRVQMRPSPDLVSHSFIAVANKVRHVFDFNDRTVLARQTPQLLITSRQRLITDAVPSPPLEVVVHRQ